MADIFLLCYLRRWGYVIFQAFISVRAVTICAFFSYVTAITNEPLKIIRQRSRSRS